MVIKIKYEEDFDVVEKLTEFMEVSLCGSAVRGHYKMRMVKKGKNIPFEITDNEDNILLTVRNMDELVRYALLGSSIHERVSANYLSSYFGSDGNIETKTTATKILDKYISDGIYANEEHCLNDEKLEFISKAICPKK